MPLMSSVPLNIFHIKSFLRIGLQPFATVCQGWKTELLFDKQSRSVRSYHAYSLSQMLLSGIVLIDLTKALCILLYALASYNRNKTPIHVIVLESIDGGIYQTSPISPQSFCVAGTKAHPWERFGNHYYILFSKGIVSSPKSDQTNITSVVCILRYLKITTHNCWFTKHTKLGSVDRISLLSSWSRSLSSFLDPSVGPANTPPGSLSTIKAVAPTKALLSASGNLFLPLSNIWSQHQGWAHGLFSLSPSLKTTKLLRHKVSRKKHWLEVSFRDRIH